MSSCQESRHKTVLKNSFPCGTTNKHFCLFVSVCFGAYARTELDVFLLFIDEIIFFFNLKITDQ